MFTNFNYTVVTCWFLVGLIVSKIIFGYFEIAVGIGYIFYPFMALFLFAVSTDSGNKEFMDSTILCLGTLGIIYIAIPLVVSIIFYRMKKLRR